MGSLETILAYVGPLQLHRFGLSLGLAFLAAIAAGVRGAKRIGVTSDQWGWLVIGTAVVSLAAARAGFVLTDAAYFAANPAEIIRLPIEGFAFPAGLAGGLAWIVFAARRLNLSWLELVDAFALPYVTALLVSASLWGGPVGEAHLLPWGGRLVDPLYVTGVYGLLWWVWVRRARGPSGALAALVVAVDGTLRFVLGAVVALWLPGGWSALLPVHLGRLAVALAGGAALQLSGGRTAFASAPPRLSRSWVRWSGWLLLYAALLAVALVSDG